MESINSINANLSSEQINNSPEQQSEQQPDNPIPKEIKHLQKRRLSINRVEHRGRQKRNMKLGKTLRFFHLQYILQSHLQNLHFLQQEMTITY